ncbi:MAG TPA: hypothetical protein VL737_04675 [Candidatus Pristimantibacillus sp.]|jgi:hypothetical protein|nr:hypothetical protein [Candidatus Pristimantibacillus sp.]
MFLFILAMSSLPVQGASSIAQGFKADDSNIVFGAIVSLKSGTANTVELSNSENVDRLLGVAGEGSLIELSNGIGSVQVVTTGQTAALVSNINGDIKTGDKITSSPIAGVGMKALTSTLVIGTAQADLSSATTETRTVTDKDGKKHTVLIGAIPLQVDKVFYETPKDQSSYVPPVLQDFANSLVGRPVSAVRVVVSALLIAFVFVTVVVLLYSSIRSSIISIGRNPLSEAAVHKSLLQVGLTVFGLMAFTVIVVYLVLST